MKTLELLFPIISNSTPSKSAKSDNLNFFVFPDPSIPATKDVSVNVASVNSSKFKLILGLDPSPLPDPSNPAPVVIPST